MTTEQQGHGMHLHTQGAIISDAPGPREGGVFAIVKRFINNQGGDLETGDTVGLDSSGTNFVKKTTILDDPTVAGVVSTGTFPDGEEVPVVIFGYHPTIKVTGSVTAGDYLTSDNSDGTASTQSTPGQGAFARATSDDDTGYVSGIVFADPSLGSGASGAATQIAETGDPADLDIAAIPDGTYLRRVGTDVIGDTPTGSIEYDPNRPPSSPDSHNDEFDDLSLDAAWTTGSSGGGSSGTIDETLRKGFVRIPVQDGGAGSGRTMYKAYVPGAVALTVVVKVYGDVRNAGSNQVRFELTDSGGTTIFGVGMVNSNQVIVFDSGGFSTTTVAYMTQNVGEMWLMITRDSGTNYSAYISNDGHIWTRITGASRSGTVARCLLEVYSFSSSFAQGWFDFVRFFTSITFDIGGTP